ncbi:MAG: type II toxin-antitoxin system VapC family toxin [Candidatus Dormibacteria bacterium]
MALVLDTSGIIALLNRTDSAHAACVAAASHDDDLVVAPLTLVEVEYWCRKAGASRAFAGFVGDIRLGAYRLAPLEGGDVDRAVELADRYVSLDLGLVDASVVALAERLRVTRLLTLDRRGFSVVRPRHCAAFELLPA